VPASMMCFTLGAYTDDATASNWHHDCISLVVGAAAAECRRPGKVIHPMIHTDSGRQAVEPRRETTYSVRTVAIVQGAYFLLTGLWPILNIDSFQAVTGTKFDLWLVYSVGAVVSVVGSTLLLAGLNRRITSEIAFLGIAAAVALVAIDVIFVVRGVISWVYLVDAAAQTGLIGCWFAALRQTMRPTPPPQYPHVKALLARSQSVSPNGGTGTHDPGAT